MFPGHLKPNSVVLALLVPGTAFLLLELLLEPASVKAALLGLFIGAVLYYLAACAAFTLRRRGVRPARFKVLVGSALLLVALDQGFKLCVLHVLPLEWERTLIPAALTLSHAHNLQGSWLAVQFGLDFIDDGLLITVSVLFIVVTLSLYRYYVDRRGRSSLWAAVAMVAFVAGLGSAFLDLALRGLTVDYLGIAGLVVADLKDFYIDIGIAALFAEIAENWRAARQMSSQKTAGHVKGALALSAREIASWLHRKRSGPAL